MRGYIYAIIAMLMSVGIAHASVVGTARINAPAVILYNNTGSITSISINVTTGNGTVTIRGPSSIGNSTTQSAQTAAMYATNFTGKNFDDYNFNYYINDSGANVSGPSGGGAMTVLAIAALENRQIPSDFAMTGTISSDGQLGEIGGVVDKVGAAKYSGLKFIIVPYAGGDQLEESLYVIGQDEYDIPVVPARNISQVINYIFNQNATVYSNESTVNLTSSYNIAGLPQAQLNCSNNCEIGPFYGIANYTINTTAYQILNISAQPGFSNIAGQLDEVLNQSRGIYSKGYIYTAADVSFLDYINAYYISNYQTNRTAALAQMQSVASYCSNLTAPTLTPANYEYIIPAELRQAWGNYTISQDISTYNVSGSTTDDILGALYTAGQASAWCQAASFAYNYSYPSSGQVYLPNTDGLRRLATYRLSAAAKYPGMYLTTAQQQFKEGNYAVAILDADYAYALPNASVLFTLPAGKLLNMSSAIAQNSTYGAWATEFSKESMFFAYQSSVATNSTRASAYADEAYSSAALAQVLSRDTMLINQNMTAANANATTTIPATTTSSGAGQSSVNVQQLQESIAELKSYVQVVMTLLVIVLVVFIISLVMLIMVISRTHHIESKQINRRRSRK